MTKGESQKRSKNVEFKNPKQDVIQAVVIADNFSEQFNCILADSPFCLLPFINSTLLDCTLKCLCQAGIQEVFLYSKYKSEDVKDYLKKSKWLKCDSLKIHFIQSQDAICLGDVLRDIDSKSLIKANFFLLHIGCIFNIQLLEILEQYRQIQAEDHEAIMTLLFRKVHSSCSMRGYCNNKVLVTDNKNKMLYHFNMKKQQNVKIPTDIIYGEKEVSVHFDVLDLSIALCSSFIPLLFSDNFDYQTLDDLIKGTLANKDIIDQSIYIHIIQNEYGAMISDFNTYCMVTLDVIHRWCYPVLNPEVNVCTGSYHYMQRQNSVYIHKSVRLNYLCNYLNEVIIGENCIIEDNSTLEYCVLSPHCELLSGSQLTNAFLFDDVYIGKKVKIKDSIIAKNVKIEDECLIGPDCIIGPGAIIPAKSELKYIQLSCIANNNQIFPGVYIHKSLQKQKTVPSLSQKIILSDHSSSYSDDTSDVESLPKSSEHLSEKLDDNPFYHEVLDSLIRGYQDSSVSYENLILEINGSKHAYNVSIDYIIECLLRAIINVAVSNINTEIKTTQLVKLQLIPVMKRFLPVIKNYVKNKETEMDCLIALQEITSIDPKLFDLLIWILNAFYSKDILSEETIQEWYYYLEEEDVKIKVAPFIKWLQEAEEEDESD